jgi:hypothetical protein
MGTWVGKMYHSLGDAWYTKQEVELGALEHEPAHYRKGYHAPRTREETVAEARACLHSALVRVPSVRVGESVREAHEKEVRTYATYYATALKTTPEEVWELTGLEHGGLWVK